MKTYNLNKILKEALNGPSSDLVTRTSGQLVRERIESEIEKENEREVIFLDFSGIGIIDYSCADEIIAKLISRLLGNEYGEKYIVLSGVNENQKENIEVALERKELAVAARMKDGGKVLMGTLNNYLKETLKLIEKKGKITAKDLAKMLGLEANTSGTRLLNLHKKRLVRRSEEVRGSGRVWVYETL